MVAAAKVWGHIKNLHRIKDFRWEKVEEVEEVGEQS